MVSLLPLAVGGSWPHRGLMNDAIQRSRRRWLVLAVVSTAQFLSAVDLWAVNLALPTLQRDFAPATLSEVAWILNVYTILLAALLIPAGRLADVIGRRRLFLAGLALFGASSLGCAIAPTLAALLVCRALQAVGAAVLLPTSLGLALPVFPERDRGAVVGIWAAVGAFAALIGPILGGVLVESSWRWIFLINVPVVLVGLSIGVFVLPRDEAGVRQRIDSLGTLLVLAAMGLVCAGLTEAAEWPALLTEIVLAAGLLIAVVCVFHVFRHSAPVVPPRLFAVRVFSVSTIGLTAYYVGFGAMLLGTSLLLTEYWSYSVLQAALAFAPGLTIAGVCAPFSGRIVQRFGTRTTLVAGAALFGVAAAWRIVANNDAPAYWTMVLPTILLWGVANALIQPTLFRAADAVPRADVASGSAVLAMARQLGSSLGVALLVVMLGSTLSTSAFNRVWALAVASAVFTAAAGLLLHGSESAAQVETPHAARVARHMQRIFEKYAGDRSASTPTG
jgi:EmrB/QacA subfamily drug resistance transporter